MDNEKVVDGSEVKLRGAWLFYVIITFIVIAGYVTALNGPAISEDLRLRILVTFLIILYIILLWVSPLLIIKKKGARIYFGVQLILPFIIGLLTPGVWLAVMLYMGMVGLGISVFWPHTVNITVVGLLGFTLSAFHLVYSWGWTALWQNLPTLVLILAFVVIYVVLFMRQTHALGRVQTLLDELENAHHQLQAYADRVEELTINQERQRMAQELHDTLIQGLAGLILQLEAVDSHLEESNSEKAQKTAQRAMRLARSTMVEARRTIQALRPVLLEQINLIHAVAREVEEFTLSTGIAASFLNENGLLDLPQDIAQDILRIFQESLANIHRHSRADHVIVRFAVQDNHIRIVIKDDGIGFEPGQAAKMQNAFGIRGMRERAERIGGILQVLSEPGKGTTILLEVEMADDSRIGH